MRGINLHGGSLKNAKVTRTDLGHSHLYNAQLHKMVTGDTKLDGADYRSTMLHKAEQARKSAEKRRNLVMATMTREDLVDAVANLSDRERRLSGLDLGRTNLGGGFFENCDFPPT